MVCVDRRSGTLTDVAPPVLLWSRFPPPEGGVTVSAVRLVNALADRGDLGGVVDLGDPRSWANGRGRTYRHLFWCSTPQAARGHALLARVARGPRLLFVHGGDPGGPGRWRPGQPFDTVFATNEALRADLAGRGLGRQLVLASPWVPPPAAVDAADEAERDGPPDGRHRILLGVGANSRWYGLDVAVDTVRRMREELGHDATLTVLGPAPELAEPGTPAWIRADGPVPDHEVPGVLARHDVLLRPSLTDGDSLLVREALHAGLRVVASDVVPRPAGVELATRTAEAFADAVIDGGRCSDGRGTGPPLLDLL